MSFLLPEIEKKLTKVNFLWDIIYIYVEVYHCFAWTRFIFIEFSPCHCVLKRCYLWSYFYICYRQYQCIKWEKRNVFEKNSKCWTHWCINKFQGDTIHENTVSRKSTSNKRGVSCCSLSAKYRLAKFVLWSILQLTSQIEEFFRIQNLHYW